MSKKKLLKYLSYIGIIGGVLLMASFFLKVADMDMNDNTGAYASGLDLTQWHYHYDYTGGQHYVPLDSGYNIFYMVFIAGFISLPLSVWRDEYLRGAGAVCGFSGAMSAIFGFLQFQEAFTDGVVNIGYGFVIAILAGLLVLLSNAIAIYVMVRKKKKPERKSKEDASGNKDK